MLCPQANQVLSLFAALDSPLAAAWNALFSNPPHPTLLVVSFTSLFKYYHLTFPFYRLNIKKHLPPNIYLPYLALFFPWYFAPAENCIYYIIAIFFLLSLPLECYFLEGRDSVYPLPTLDLAHKTSLVD
jgi:hypothetical protein